MTGFLKQRQDNVVALYTHPPARGGGERIHCLKRQATITSKTGANWAVSGSDDPGTNKEGRVLHLYHTKRISRDIKQVGIQPVINGSQTRWSVKRVTKKLRWNLNLFAINKRVNLNNVTNN